MKLRRSLLVLAALVLPLVACGLIVGIDEHNFTTPDGSVAMMPTDAGPDVPAIAPTCTFGAAPPLPPPPFNGVDQFRDGLVFAVRHATLRAKGPDGNVVGFDFDGVCSCDERDHSLHAGAVSCVPPGGLQPGRGCDDDGGIDNAIGGALELLSLVPEFATSADAINAQIECGRQTMIYTLLGYNGQANDSVVTLTGLQSNGIHEPQDGGTTDAGNCGVDEAGLEAGGTYPAKFDGTDVWSKPVGGGAAGLNGFVRDFQLVLDGRPQSTLAAASLPVLFGSRVLNIATPIVVAHLVPLDDNGNRLVVDSAGKILSPSGKASSFLLENGLVGGRASSSDVLAATAAIRRPGVISGNAELCADPEKYCQIKDAICGATDTMALPGLDFQGMPCDALSVVLQFDAVVAHVATAEWPSATAEAGCAQDWMDSCGDAARCLP